MVFVPALNTVEVFMEHSCNGKEGVGWVLHYRGALGAWAIETLTDLSTQLIAWWDTEIQPIVSNTTFLTRIRFRDLTVQNGQVYDRTIGLPLQGALTSPALPNNVSFSLKKNSGVAGKSFRGRTYMLGLTEADVTANSIAGATANAFVDAFNEAIILVGAEDTYAMALVSKYTAGNPRANALVTNVISFTYADLVVDTRRDRL